MLTCQKHDLAVLRRSSRFAPRINLDCLLRQRHALLVPSVLKTPLHSTPTTDQFDLGIDELHKGLRVLCCAIHCLGILMLHSLKQTLGFQHPWRHASPGLCGPALPSS